MHINQLLDIIQFIHKSASDSNLLDNYRNLLHVIKHSSGNYAEAEFFDDYHSKIQNVLSTLDPVKWDDVYYKTFLKFENKDVLGKAAALRFENLLKLPHKEIVISELEKIISEANEFADSLQKLKTSLEPMVRSVAPGKNSGIDIEERHHLLYIQFNEGIFIKNISQLEKFCRIWNRILVSFAYLTHEAAEEVRVFDIESSSITFYTGIKTINSLTRGAIQTLKGYKKVLEVRRLQLELDGLNLSNKEEIKTLLEEEMVNIVDVISGSVTSEFMSKYNWNNSVEYDTVYSQVQISLKQIMNFIEKGGYIDSNHAGELRSLNKNVIEILNNIKQLENPARNIPVNDDKVITIESD